MAWAGWRELETEQWAAVQGVPPGPCLECADRSVWVEKLCVA